MQHLTNEIQTEIETFRVWTCSFPREDPPPSLQRWRDMLLNR